MNKVISMYSIIVFLIGFSSFTNAADTPNSNSNFRYEEALGGVYSDYWRLKGDINNLYIFREGHSGSLKAPISIDCKSKKFKVTGEGMVWDIQTSVETLTEYINKEVVDAVIKEVCKKYIKN